MISRAIASKHKFWSFILMVSACILAESTWGQTAALTTAKPAEEEWFDAVIGPENTGILNGTKYKIDFLGAASNPFFITEVSNGQVVYNQQRYLAPLLYDLYKDALVIKHITPSGAVWFIELDKKSVREFIINENRFKNLSGVYHQIFFESERFSLVCKRAKLATVKNQQRNYIEHNQYFLATPSKSFRFSSVATFKKLLISKENIAQFKSFLASHGIKSGSHRDNDFIKAAAFVDELLSKIEP